MTISEFVEQEIYSDKSLLDGSIEEYRKDIERAVAKYALDVLEKQNVNIPDEAFLAKSNILNDINNLKQFLKNDRIKI